MKLSNEHIFALVKDGLLKNLCDVVDFKLNIFEIKTIFQKIIKRKQHIPCMFLQQFI